MGRYANYVIEKDTEKYLLIRDQGPWDLCFTVTNDAENVVKRLVQNGRLKPDQRLFYYDSDGELGELLVKNGEFNGFGVVLEHTLQRLSSVEEQLRQP